MNLQRAFSATRWAWPPVLLLALAALLILISPPPRGSRVAAGRAFLGVPDPR